ncbi:TauD/TfdA dioxygenase family protein [Pseudochelatococcus contaminans]|uniref:Taurine dioxygenase n=1 Tax=Pseudochelatococcus contaminans TaxID=1538103 RepID=A0A7W5Z5M3_9HYPH|nr:TauD/TfdA family dioxygenase [Pseudochelatococcus contaminans]MBB3810285.1 taurine dioxygenase [Pseudochelatococcus contaminans]
MSASVIPAEQAAVSTIPQSDIHPLSGHIGARIDNIRLSGDLPADVFADIHRLLLQYKVLFFRDQDHLDDTQQEAFGKLFGDLVPHPTVGSVAGTSSVLELDANRTGERASGQGGGRADQWHTDVTFVDAYPKISILRGVEIPDFGGDTVWANTVTAYEHLSPELRQLADSLWAVHSNAYDYAAVRPHANEDDHKQYNTYFTSTIYETEHPVVRVHPETGERTLLLGNFVQRFVGQNRADSARLYELFQSHITAPENIVRWVWKANDVAIWDNRATQHYAVNDYGDKARLVRRVTIDGEVPVGVDGRKSVTRSRYAKPRLETIEGGKSA